MEVFDVGSRTNRVRLAIVLGVVSAVFIISGIAKLLGF